MKKFLVRLAKILGSALILIIIFMAIVIFNNQRARKHTTSFCSQFKEGDGKKKVEGMLSKTTFDEVLRNIPKPEPGESTIKVTEYGFSLARSMCTIRFKNDLITNIRLHGLH